MSSFPPSTSHIPTSMMNELLLIVSVLGTTTDTPEQSSVFIPVSDVNSWLQDLQRALRSDKDDTRDIAILLHKWKVVEEKLIPIAIHKR